MMSRDILPHLARYAKSWHSITMLTIPLLTSDSSVLNLQRLVMLRSVFVAGQILAVWVVSSALDVSLSLFAIGCFDLVAAQVTVYRGRRGVVWPFAAGCGGIDGIIVSGGRLGKSVCVAAVITDHHYGHRLAGAIFMGDGVDYSGLLFIANGILCALVTHFDVTRCR